MLVAAPMRLHVVSRFPHCIHFRNSTLLPFLSPSACALVPSWPSSRMVDCHTLRAGTLPQRAMLRCAAACASMRLPLPLSCSRCGMLRPARFPRSSAAPPMPPGTATYPLCGLLMCFSSATYIDFPLDMLPLILFCWSAWQHLCHCCKLVRPAAFEPRL